jgi:ATP-binding cassette subfamily F protein 3
VRAQLGRFGFTGPLAEQRIGTMSGGEKARLALALVTRDAPHLIVLDEPTNHLDIDSREALVQALAGYDGAVVVVSHDRHVIEASADRLVLVDSGRASPFEGSIDDYEALILSGPSSGTPAAAPGAARAPRIDPKEARRQAAARREAAKPLRQAMLAAEAKMNRLIAERESVDEQMTRAPADITALMQRRGVLDAGITAAEDEWAAASEAYDAAVATP